jgi:hypothetical protein
MREVVATLFSSVDGYATGRDPEDMDWAVNYQGPETLQLGLDTIRDSDLTVLGRVTGTKPVFEGFDRTTMELVNSRVLDGQVVLLDYHPAR